ncbi:R-spondin-4 isoform X2 [Anabas testudineus]|uniref:R-spondin-4 isoform X2 n=1 Tax=Anabas testudineus TaxID=64144 RepID=UPI000E457940|nr:R-spondin-4 isoform X2 [Anabas testudineus]
MHLRLFAIVISLVCEVIRMGSGVAQKQTAHKETTQECPNCDECSTDNGCVRCAEKLFLLLERKGMSHHGTCVQTCPAGHYGLRGLGVSHCMKCRSLECEHCFSRDFCTKCKTGFLLYKGKCLTSCPEGTFSHDSDCLDCQHVPPGEWSEWSTCHRDGSTCGFRWGKHTRTRGGLTGDKAATHCPSHSETQRCRMKKKCPTDARIKKKDLEERERENDNSCTSAAVWATRRTEQTPPQSTRTPEDQTDSPAHQDTTHIIISS